MTSLREISHRLPELSNQFCAYNNPIYPNHNLELFQIDSDFWEKQLFSLRVVHLLVCGVQ